ncbi:MAG: CPP1-like family protein [Microcystaceae cyanobacterium]
MSEQTPYEKLGVTENASFEEIQAAKQRLTEQSHEDGKVVESIESAYDAIIMERLRMRQEGKIKVPERIRFPERLVETPSTPSPITTKNPSNWLRRFIDTPSLGDLLWPAGVFILLAVITVFAQGNGDSRLPLLMAFGVFANIYFLNRKEQRFGRALLMTLIGLLLGIISGNGIANVLGLPGNEIPLSVGQFASLVTFGVFWLISSFLR